MKACFGIGCGAEFRVARTNTKIFLIAALLNPFTALGYDFYGPASPRDEYACTNHFEGVWSEWNRELQAFVKANCTITNAQNETQRARYKACYDRVGQARENYHRQHMTGRSACWERARGIADRERSQANAERRSRDQTSQTPQRYDAQRITAIPVPPRQGRPAPPTTSEKAEAVGALAGLLFSRLFNERVEEELGPAPRTELNRDIERRNAEAFEEFDRLRTALKTHIVVKQFQNLAWDQLNQQVQTVFGQFAALEQRIGEIVEKVPAEQVSGTEKATFTYRPSVSLEYAGSVDPQGRPHGLGVATGNNSDEGFVAIAGTFVSGELVGAGRIVKRTSEGTTTITSEFDRGEPSGPTRMVSTSLDGREVITIGHYGAKEPQPFRLTSSDQTRYRGLARWGTREIWVGGKSHKNPYFELSGVGELTRSNGAVLLGQFQNDELHGLATVTYPNGTQKRCSALNGACFGTTEIIGADGTYGFGRQDGGLWEGEIHRAGHDYVFSGIAKNGRWHGPGRIVWSTGAKYEGDWTDGDRTGIGRLEFPGGSTLVGRFEKGELTDGVRFSADGSRVAVGQGTAFQPPQFHSSLTSLEGLSEFYQQLPYELAIQRAGTSDHELVLFIDIDGYSRKAVDELARMHDVKSPYL